MRGGASSPLRAGRASAGRAGRTPATPPDRPAGAPPPGSGILPGLPWTPDPTFPSSFRLQRGGQPRSPVRRAARRARGDRPHVGTGHDRRRQHRRHRRGDAGRVRARPARRVAAAREKNAGQSAALAAGLSRARGEVVVTLDADLQNDPADLPRVLAALENADVVSGIRPTAGTRGCASSRAASRTPSAGTCWATRSPTSAARSRPTAAKCSSGCRCSSACTASCRRLRVPRRALHRGEALAPKPAAMACPVRRRQPALARHRRPDRRAVAQDPAREVPDPRRPLIPARPLIEGRPSERIAATVGPLPWPTRGRCPDSVRPALRHFVPRNARLRRAGGSVTRPSAAVRNARALPTWLFCPNRTRGGHLCRTLRLVGTGPAKVFDVGGPEPPMK